MMTDSFLSIKDNSEGLYKEKGSKFLAIAFPVNNENEVIKIIKSVKKEHYNARHHCYAYIIKNEDIRFRSNDDGEPRHTAGDPILNQIRSFKLNNVLVVVVRYFGGTKLGKTGLINAYKTASKEALIKATIIEKVHRSEIAINFKYDGINDVMNFIQKNNFEILTQKYEESCYITGLIPKSQVQEIINDLTGYKNVINVVQLPGR
jgi:uncharacterized YigZ family protein